MRPDSDVFDLVLNQLSAGTAALVAGGDAAVILFEVGGRDTDFTGDDGRPIRVVLLQQSHEGAILGCLLYDLPVFGEFDGDAVALDVELLEVGFLGRRRGRRRGDAFGVDRQ